MKALRKILAIVRTEFRFAFRRGAPVVVTALVGLLVAAGTSVAALASVSEWASNSTVTPEKIERLTSFGLTVDQWTQFLRVVLSDMYVGSTLMAWLLMFIALLFLPVATAMSIPADRRFGVSELLRSTPITGFSYLVGKLLGSIAAVLLVGTSVLALFFAVNESILFGKLHYGLSPGAGLFLIKLALLDGLPMLVWGTAVGVLIGVPFRSRRAALFPGFLAGVASLIGWAVVFRAPAHGYFGMTDLAYCYLLQNYHSSTMAFASQLGVPAVDMFKIAGTPVVGIGQLALMYLAILLALVILALLARLWLRWKENF